MAIFDPATCKAMYEAGGWTHRTLAEHFGVSNRQVRKALNPEWEWQRGQGRAWHKTPQGKRYRKARYIAESTGLSMELARSLVEAEGG